jgi:hypothetical protein
MTRARKVLYITSPAFSGSTLLTFLLNLHPRVVAVGHMQGWAPPDGEVLTCSCGSTLDVCPFYRHIAAAYAREGLPFDPRDFGTRYAVFRDPRLNAWLTKSLPLLESSTLERTRDRMLRSLGVGAGRRLRIDRANLVFIGAALSWRGAEAFVDNTHDAYRLRHLGRLGDLDIRIVHLIRDPRGVALSNRDNHGWDPVVGARLWLRRHRDILRIAAELGPRHGVHYEDLCAEPERELAAIHRFAGLEPRPIGEDFGAVEHHILGNRMRLGGKAIRRDERWKTDLPAADRRAVETTVRAFARAHPGHPLSGWIERYLGA